jgi:glycopeptide antibiotics resistance protein
MNESSLTMTPASFSTGPPRKYLGTGTFALLTVGYLFIVVYGSLVPFHYRPLSWEESFARWDQVLQLPLGMDSRTDFATNVLLFIPLGFLSVGTLAVNRGRLISCLAGLAVIPLCAALSAAIEFTQLWFPPRVTSMNDVLGETIGAVIGAATWVIAGQGLTQYARSAWAAWGPENLAVRLLPAYLFFLVVVHVMPLDLTISPGELYHKWKEGRIILIPFTTDGGHLARYVLGSAWNMAYLFPLGALLSLWPTTAFRHGPKVLMVGLLTAAGIEVLHLFVWTRVVDTTAILTGGTAVWLGWLAMEALRTRRAIVAAGQPLAWPAPIRPGLLLTWFLAMVLVNWWSFDVLAADEARSQLGSATDAARPNDAWVLSDDGCRVQTPDGSQEFSVRLLGPFVVFNDMKVVHERWSRTPLVPMVDLQMGSDYHAFDEVVRKLLLFLPLGALLVPRSAAQGRPGLWRALLAGLLLSGLFEVGQLFIPDRTCSTSDVLVETTGAVLGFVLCRRLLVILEGRTTPEASPAAIKPLVRIPVGLGVFVSEEPGKH